MYREFEGGLRILCSEGVESEPPQTFAFCHEVKWGFFHFSPVWVIFWAHRARGVSRGYNSVPKPVCVAYMPADLGSVCVIDQGLVSV